MRICQFLPFLSSCRWGWYFVSLNEMSSAEMSFYLNTFQTSSSRQNETLAKAINKEKCENFEVWPRQAMPIGGIAPLSIHNSNFGEIWIYWTNCFDLYKRWANWPVQQKLCKYHGVDVINKFQSSITTLLWKNAIWLYDASYNVTNFVQSECFFQNRFLGVSVHSQIKNFWELNVVHWPEQ